MAIPEVCSVHFTISTVSSSQTLSAFHSTAGTRSQCSSARGYRRVSAPSVTSSGTKTTHRGAGSSTPRMNRPTWKVPERGGDAPIALDRHAAGIAGAADPLFKLPLLLVGERGLQPVHTISSASTVVVTSITALRRRWKRRFMQGGGAPNGRAPAIPTRSTGWRRQRRR